MRLSICPCFCCVFTGIDDAVRHRLWGSICSAIRHAPIYMSMLLLCFYGFRRCCTAPPLDSGDQFGTPWARMLLGFRCCASMPHGCVHRPCPPIRADMSSYPPCAYLSMLLSMLLAVFLRVSKMLFGTASGDQFGTPWARILLGFRCFASMPHGCVHRLCPPIRADMSIYIRHDAPI